MSAVQTSFASKVISALSTLETGEFCSASCANRVCGVIQILFLEAIREAEAI